MGTHTAAEYSYGKYYKESLKHTNYLTDSKKPVFCTVIWLSRAGKMGLVEPLEHVLGIRKHSLYELIGNFLS